MKRLGFFRVYRLPLVHFCTWCIYINLTSLDVAWTVKEGTIHVVDSLSLAMHISAYWHWVFWRGSGALPLLRRGLQVPNVSRVWVFWVLP